MMIFPEMQMLSPIILSVTLIVYLIIIELGNEKIKKVLMPLVISVGIVFLITAIINVLSKI